MIKTRTIAISLAEQAYELIRDEIILCGLKPGEVVSETILEVRFGLVRSAVRSAMARLTQERLIKVVGTKSRIVAPLTISDIRDVFLLRRKLEPLAARLAAGNVSEKLLRILDDACRRAYESGDRKGELEFLGANRRFHLAIAEASGSLRLAQTIEYLHNEAMRMLYLSFQYSNRSDEWSHGHENIVKALVRPDPDDAERIALSLLDNSFAEIMQAALNNPRLQDAQLT